MSNIIVNPKNYTGHELENIFFRPLLTGPSAESLGIRILYNMPMPTVVHIWDRKGNVLTPFDKSSSWSGGIKSNHLQKTIPMSRVKAENAFSASDYFSTVFELITNRPDINMEDLSGTDLESAETELFRRAISESIRMNLWLGDKGGTLNTGYTGFDGLLKIVDERVKDNSIFYGKGNLDEYFSEYQVNEIFDLLIKNANPRLKGLYPEGQVMFVIKDGAENDNSRFIPIDSSNEGDWSQLHDQATSDIVIAHSWFRSLSGLDYSAGFSAERILHEYEVALNTVILAEQEVLLAPIKRIIEQLTGEDASSLEIVNRPPTRSKPIYMRVWEARKADGLEYDENDPEQQQFLSEITKYNVTKIN